MKRRINITPAPFLRMIQYDRIWSDNQWPKRIVVTIAKRIKSHQVRFKTSEEPGLVFFKGSFLKWKVLDFSWRHALTTPWSQERPHGGSTSRWWWIHHWCELYRPELKEQCFSLFSAYALDVQQTLEDGRLFGTSWLFGAICATFYSVFGLPTVDRIRGTKALNYEWSRKKIPVKIIWTHRDLIENGVTVWQEVKSPHKLTKCRSFSADWSAFAVYAQAHFARYWNVEAAVVFRTLRGFSMNLADLDDPNTPG